MKNTSRQPRNTVRGDALRPEYQFGYSRSRGNHFASKLGSQTVAVVLEPDVAEVFDSSRSVNKLLRPVIAAVPRADQVHCAGRRKGQHRAGADGVQHQATRASSTPPPTSGFRVRRAFADDAAGIAAVLRKVASERVHSAIERAWTVPRQRRYLKSLSVREASHVAVTASERVVGYQSLDLYSPFLTSMAHVAQLGTFLMPEWRRRGIGRALFDETVAFARSSGYRKIVIQVRASNTSARSFYRQLGFTECGRLIRQVVIDGREDDEIIMESSL